jgi:hypothetical protein
MAQKPMKLNPTIVHCRTRNCRGFVGKSGKSPYCAKCRTRRWKAKYPLHYSFAKLQARARERKKDFSLTRSQYIYFAKSTGYEKMKGKTSFSLSIDRIDDKQGYHWWNIQAITLRENTRKQFVPYFARQMENQNYEPTAEELAAIERQITA